MFQVSFSQASRWNSFFLLVSFLLRLVHWFVSASHRVRFELSFCLFFLWWATLNEVGILSSDGLVCIFIFLLLFRWGLLHKALPVLGWFRVLHSGGFLCVISHYLRLVIELVLWMSRVLGSVLPLQMLRAWSLSKDQLHPIYQKEFHLKWKDLYSSSKSCAQERNGDLWLSGNSVCLPCG